VSPGFGLIKLLKGVVTFRLFLSQETKRKQKKRREQREKDWGGKRQPLSVVVKKEVTKEKFDKRGKKH